MPAEHRVGGRADLERRRVLVHVADTDEQALDDMTNAMKSGPRTGLTMANRTLEGAVADAGYYGRDREEQRQRLMPRGLKESIDLGQVALGSPDTVARQIERIGRVRDPTIQHPALAGMTHAGATRPPHRHLTRPRPT